MHLQRLILLTLLLFTLSIRAFSQPGDQGRTQISEEHLPKHQSPQKIVVVTGARFSYKLIEKWIDRYSRENPHVQIIVEARGSADPLNYDILAEVYEHDEEVAITRQYLYVARYAILPVATQGSLFARHYLDKGLNNETISEVFFHNIFRENGRRPSIPQPFTVYTRLQKAGVPKIFAEYFGRWQKDIRGTAIAGADSHLLKALLRDSAGVSYLPLALIYDEKTRQPIPGLSVLPVDLNGNKKVSDDEKFYDNLDAVIEKFAGMNAGEIRNIPIAHLHLSIPRENASVDAVEFLKWVNERGQEDLHEYGYLRADPKKFTKETFENFADKREK